jgi:hypothetical protein
LIREMFMALELFMIHLMKEQNLKSTAENGGGGKFYKVTLIPKIMFCSSQSRILFRLTKKMSMVEFLREKGANY